MFKCIYDLSVFLSELQSQSILYDVIADNFFLLLASDGITSLLPALTASKGLSIGCVLPQLNRERH